MANILDQLRMWAEQMVSTFGYVGIAFLMFIENVFPPIPSEVIMPFAGSLAATGQMNVFLVFVAGTIGALAGAIFIYYIGIWLTEERVRAWIESYGRYLLLSVKDYDKSMSAFNAHGEKMVLFGRVLPTIRSLISIPAGLNEMSMKTFLLYTTIGTAIWNVILLGAGYALGENWEQVLTFIDTYNYIFWGIIGILVIYSIFKRVRSSGEEAQTTS